MICVLINCLIFELSIFSRISTIFEFLTNFDATMICQMSTNDFPLSADKFLIFRKSQPIFVFLTNFLFSFTKSFTHRQTVDFLSNVDKVWISREKLLIFDRMSIIFDFLTNIDKLLILGEMSTAFRFCINTRQFVDFRSNINNFR